MKRAGSDCFEETERCCVVLYTATAAPGSVTDAIGGMTAREILEQSLLRTS